MASKIMLVVAGTFLLLGLSSLIVGIVVPIVLHDDLVEEGKKVSHIDENDDPNVWSNIPGDRQYTLTQEYEFFNILRPNDFKYGLEPEVQSVGKVVLTETRNTTKAGFNSFPVDTYDGKEEIMIEFTQNINLEVTEGEDLLKKAISTPNPDVFAKLAATHDSTPWFVASRALKQIFDFTVNDYYWTATVAHLKLNSNYINKSAFMASRGKLLVDYGVDLAQAEKVWDDESYGFIERENLRTWGDVCTQSSGGYYKRVLLDFFDINFAAMNAFLQSFCQDWEAAVGKVKSQACITSNCLPEEIFFEQWAESRISEPAFERGSMNHLHYIEGEPEVKTFLDEVFFINKSDAFKKQFESVDFLNNHSKSNYARYFSESNMKDSLFNFTTVKTLFEIGNQIDAKNSTGEVQVDLYAPLTSFTEYITNKECYVLYKYLQNLANSTYLQGENHDVASFAYNTAPLFKNEIQDIVIDFGSEIIGMGLYRFFKDDTCPEAVQRLFPGKYSQSTRICKELTSPNTLDGLKFWIRLYVGRRQSDLNLLEDVTSYKFADFSEDFDKDNSNFHLTLNSILDSIGIGKIQQDICNQDYNELCSIHEIGMNQWLSSAFTKSVPVVFENEYKPHESWIDSFNKDPTEYLKNEISYFVYIQPLYDKHGISMVDCFREFKFGKLFEPFYFMNFLQEEVEQETPFDDPVFIAYLGIIYKNRFFKPMPLIKEILIEDILIETVSQDLVDIQQAPLSKGGNPLIKTTNRAIPYPKLKDNVLKWQLLSGHEVEDFVRRVYSYNSSYTYATVEKTYYHENRDDRYTGITTYTEQPWRKEVYLSFGSDSIQYEPNIGQKSDIAYYSPMFKAHLDMDYTDVSTVYDIKTYDYKHKGKFFELSNNDKNSYHNYVYQNTFNATSVFQSSIFITTPRFSSFSSNMKQHACVMRDESGNDMTFNSKDDTKIQIEFYSGIALKSKQTFQVNYMFDTYAKSLDSYAYFLPAYIYTQRLIMGEDFAKSYFASIRDKEQTRKLILIICFAVGGVLFALGISACIIIFIRSNKDDEESDEEPDENAKDKVDQEVKSKNAIN